MYRTSFAPRLAGGLYADSIVDTIREPLVLLTGDLHIARANAAFCRVFDTAREEVEGRFFYDVNDGEFNLPELRQLLEQILPARADMHDFEVEPRSRQGGRRTMLLNATRLNHPDNGVRLVLLAFEDITERRRLERALRGAMTELERSNRELEAFASIASHDLQEPLRKILAFGERLDAVCAGGLPDKGRDYLARMTSAAARMQALIVNLLSLARVSSKGGSWEAVDLGAVVAEVVADLEEALSRSEGRVEVGPLPTIAADPTQMRQLFQNLIGNGLKFKGAAAPIIRITASERGRTLPSHPKSEERVIWQIVVSDNGIGFDQKFAERIFKPFERLHGRAAFEGTGIGLALCRRIVQRHGGTMSAESTPGDGARFTILIPEIQKESYDQ